MAALQSVMALTGLDAELASALLAAADGNVDLAIELHFDDGLPSATAAAAAATAGDESITILQRFSGLAIDGEDAESSDSDEDMFPLTVPNDPGSSSRSSRSPSSR